MLSYTLKLFDHYAFPFGFGFISNVNLRELNVLNYLGKWLHIVPIAE